LIIALIQLLKILDPRAIRLRAAIKGLAYFAEIQDAILGGQTTRARVKN